MFDDVTVLWCNNIETGSSSGSTGFCFAKLKQEEGGQFNQILEGNHGS